MGRIEHEDRQEDNDVPRHHPAPGLGGAPLYARASRVMVAGA